MSPHGSGMMSDSKRPEQKQRWRRPEIVNVGCVFDLTEGMATNVRDSTKTPPTYNKGSGITGEVDLEGR